MSPCLGELVREAGVGPVRAASVGVWNTQGTEWLLWGALWHLPGIKAPCPAAPPRFSGKSTAGCRPNRHGNHPRKRFLLGVGNALQDGLGWAGERLLSVSLAELQMEKRVQVWRHLCVTVSGVV